MKSQARGGTRWKRFAIVMVPSVAASGAVAVAIAQGALAASFQVSGQQFQVTAGHIHGEGFTQYGSVDPNKKGPNPVAVVGLSDADISSLCQAVNVPTPFGEVGMTLKAGDGDTKVHAKGLYIDADDLQVRQAQFNDIDLGVAAGSTSKGPGISDGDRKKTSPDSFAQQARSVDFDGVNQRAWATTAGSFTLPGLHMGVSLGHAECKVPGN
ncbi:DUF6230 family protein [Streptomyces orinoci]|uniref:DUF6230 family protein n=1 Tax=Streptomyces orinoci TaxID=67339 RepID=A0ABV3K6G6_STRON|nr:DUF6230 family protein [Streptomyces orinoci]